MPPAADTSARLARIVSLMLRNRSPGSIGPAGTESRVGVNELPPIASSVRVLTTKLVFSDAQRHAALVVVARRRR